MIMIYSIAIASMIVISSSCKIMRGCMMTKKNSNIVSNRLTGRLQQSLVMGMAIITTFKIHLTSTHPCYVKKENLWILLTLG